MRLVVLFSIGILFLAPQSRAQHIPDSLVRKIDALFKRWDNWQRPGCAIAVVRNDSVIYSRGYGMANLEYDVPISPSTIFHVASVSKQFTSYAIVLLERQNKLRLDDDIRKHLPWFPDLQRKITIRHLLTHTSGIRDQWQLLAIAGTRNDDVITQEHIMKVLARQRALNFEPGERYLYSNSGHTLLAEVVSAVTGRTLRQFLDSAVFKPLGMVHTHFHDNYREIVRNRAYSYSRIDSTRFANSILSFSNVGATSLFTTATDLARWIMNFYQTRAGTPADIARLTETTPLNNGKLNNYAHGIIVSEQAGWRKYSHSGSDAGYRSFISVFPELRMGFVLLSNVAEFQSGAMADALSRIFIPEKGAEGPSRIGPDSSRAHFADAAWLKRVAGHYASDDGLHVELVPKGNNLFIRIGSDERMMAGRPDDTLGVLAIPDIRLVVHKNGKDISFLHGGETTFLVRQPESPHTAAELRTYTGRYYCPELDVTYNIELRGNQLYMTHHKYNDTPVRLIGKDHLFPAQYRWMGHLLVLRDAKGSITGFEVNHNRIQHLWFDKL